MIDRYFSLFLKGLKIFAITDSPFKYKAFTWNSTTLLFVIVVRTSFVFLVLFCVFTSDMQYSVLYQRKTVQISNLFEIWSNFE